MKSFILLGLSCIGLFFVITGCSKKSSAQTETKMQLVTAAPWKYDTAGIDLNGDGSIDESLPSGTIPTCVLDNTLTFNSDSTGQEDEGAVKCDSTNQTTAFTWSFNASQTVINFPDSLFGSFGGAVNITSLTTTQLHVEKAVTQSGLTFNVAIYFKH